MSGRLSLWTDTALSFNRLRRVSPYTSLPSNHSLPKLIKTLPVNRDLPKQQIRASLMADQAPKAIEPEEKKNGVVGEEKPSPAPPPPPEKPLAGDCCGSGCVRCVWDIYYEDLEEYNKLYPSDSAPKP